ncbi:hypothetical protein, partial [Shrimp hemocyte iridescent virus]
VYVDNSFASRKKSKIEYNTFIQSGNEVTIDTSTNPRWLYILCWVKLKNYHHSTILFRNDVRKRFNSKRNISRININEALGQVDSTFILMGDVKIENMTIDSVTILVENFGKYNTTLPITFTAFDNDPEFGVEKIVIV